MEHARLTLMAADPAKLPDAVRYIENDARRRIENEPGNRGMAVSTDDEVGVALVSSFWVSGDAMRESARATAPLRAEAARRAGGTVSVESHEVESARRMARAEPGAGVRLARLELDPTRLDDVVGAYEDAALPWLAEADGFCSHLLFVHRRTGQAVDETVWRDAGALTASRSAAAAIRVDAVAASDAVVRSLVEYRLAFTSAPVL
jgi:heme-degrading monooxygenase HmoA